MPLTSAEVANLNTLADRIRALTPADRLRLAADFIEQGLSPFAESITRHVCEELAAARVLVPPTLTAQEGRS